MFRSGAKAIAIVTGIACSGMSCHPHSDPHRSRNCRDPFSRQRKQAPARRRRRRSTGAHPSTAQTSPPARCTRPAPARRQESARRRAAPRQGYSAARRRAAPRQECSAARRRAAPRRKHSPARSRRRARREARRASRLRRSDDSICDRSPLRIARILDPSPTRGANAAIVNEYV